MRERGLLEKRYATILVVTIGCIGFIISTRPGIPTPDAFSSNTTRYALVSLLTVEGPQAWWSQQKYTTAAEKLASSFRKQSNMDMVLLVVDEYGVFRRRDEARLKTSGWSVHRLKKGIVPRYEGWNQFYSEKLFSKLWIWRLTMYEQILYTDLDVLFMQSPEPLFSMHLPVQNPAMALDTTRRHYYNTGVMLLRPSENEYQRLISSMNANTHGSEFTEQEFLNIFYHSRIVTLHPRYNVQVCDKGSCLNDETAGAFNAGGTAILHFSGDSKPWNMQNCIRQKIIQACQLWKHYSI
jgi:hypothetical protein